MNSNDLKLVSLKPIQYGATLQRVINRGGVPYSAIVVDGYEIRSLPTERENELLDRWAVDGKECVRLFRDGH